MCRDSSKEFGCVDVGVTGGCGCAAGLARLLN